MFDSIVVLLFCFIGSVLASSNPAGEVTNKFGTPFSRIHNSFYRKTVDKEQLEPAITDYVSVTAKLLDDIKHNKPVAADDLNKFGDGILQYYSSKASEYYYSHQKSAGPVVNLAEPIFLSNFTTQGSPEIVFYDVKVNGFPPFQPNKNIITDFSSTSPDLQTFLAQFTATSEMTIFAGRFYVYQKYQQSASFVFITTNSKYKSDRSQVRNKVGIVKSSQIEDTLRFHTTHFAHSYDNDFDHYGEVAGTIFPKFTTAVESAYLPALAAASDPIITSRLASKSVESGEKHLKNIADTLVQAAVQFSTLNNFSTYHVRPLRFQKTNDPAENRSAIIVYDDIKVEGLLNFVKYEFTNLPRAENQSLVKLSDKIKFSYSESEDKGAFLSFTIKLREKDSIKRYRIRSLLVETAFLANVAVFPPQISPNTEAFESKTGLYISLNVDMGEAIYYFIAKHAGRDLTRTVDSLVYGTKYPE